MYVYMYIQIRRINQDDETESVCLCNHQAFTFSCDFLMMVDRFKLCIIKVVLSASTLPSHRFCCFQQQSFRVMNSQ